ncbi:MAG TPA: hypothetical protein PLK90_05410 [Clostridiales bacterium]|nr:hypothetical protein [Clostridiales bacterium]HQP69819.1 hypothetical protein [Clostridiales bacterium]
MKYFIILFSILLLSAGYLFIREKTLEKYVSPEINYREATLDSASIAASIKFSGKGVIIFDIPDLDSLYLTDSLRSPILFRIYSNSRIFASTHALSPDRITSLKSFFECLAPYKADDGKEPYRSLKSLIADSLRNSSVPQEYSRSGYVTKFFTSDSLLGNQAGKYFSAGLISGSKEKVLEDLYYNLSSDLDTPFFYYADLSAGYGTNENYYTDIDHQIGSTVDRIREKLKYDPVFLFVSSKRTYAYKDYPAFFYGSRFKKSYSEAPAALTDIAKTLLSVSGIRPPNYFSGYDADNEEEFIERDYFAGCCGDTLLLFNRNNVYKQLKHSPEYFFYDLNLKKDVTTENIGINEKFVPMLPKYFGGDYAKFIILKNKTDKSADFSFSIKSNRRFEDFKAISNYYKAEKKNGKYIKDFKVEVSAESSDTLAVYYSHLYQNFDYTFSGLFSISYGSAGINTGKVKSFDENSYYGMKYFFDGVELFNDYDVRIYNVRINY